MLRSEAITIIQRGLGFRTDLNDEIVSALKEAQRLEEMGRTLPDFLKQEEQPLIISSGSGNVSLPTGFIREMDGETLRYVDSATSETVWLEKFTSLNLLRQTLGGATTSPGKPLGYYLLTSTMVVLPTRNAAYTATWSYYKGADLLSSDIENAWLANAPDVLIGRAGMIICVDVGSSDPAMAKRLMQFTQRYEMARRGLFAEKVLDEEVNYSLSMGSRL